MFKTKENILTFDLQLSQSSPCQHIYTLVNYEKTKCAIELTKQEGRKWKKIVKELNVYTPSLYLQGFFGRK